MSILLSEMVQGFEKLVCVRRDTTVQEALDIMLPKQFSQLPIVDGDRQLIGVVSEHSIVRAFNAHKKPYDTVAKLRVIDCLDLDKNTTLSPGDDIFDAMERLETASYVIVVDPPRVPVGIVTSYDTGKIFRALGEVLDRASDMEMLLRESITRATFWSNKTVEDALRNAGSDQKGMERLTFGDLINIIENGKNWPLFERVFGSQQFSFRHHMERPRDIRNDIAHFRRKATQQDVAVMNESLRWLRAHELLPPPLTEEEQSDLFDLADLFDLDAVAPPASGNTPETMAEKNEEEGLQLPEDMELF